MIQYWKQILLWILGSLWSAGVLATPAEVIIIRHSDKLPLTQAGPFLSSIGQIRAINFAFYFQEHFANPNGNLVDYIIPTNPKYDTGVDSSAREMQTIAPLANMLSENPEQKFIIMHHYVKDQYKQLAKDLLTEPMFNGKRILLCWNHKFIPPLAHELGITGPILPWYSDEYDTVYDIKYNSHGKASLMILYHQYPVSFHQGWTQIHQMIF